MPMNQQVLSRRTFLTAAAVMVASIELSSLSFTKRAFALTAAEVQAQADEVSAQLAQWQAQLDQTSDAYYEALSEHDAAVDAMNAAQDRIDAAQTVISSTQGKLSSRAASMYKNGEVSYLDVLLGAASFADFVNTWDILNKLNSQDADLVGQLNAAKAEAEAAHTEYARQADTAQERLNAAAAARDQAEQLTQQYRAKLNSLNTQVKELLDSEKAAEDAAAAAAASRSSSGGSSSGSSPSYSSDGSALSTVVAAAYSQRGVPYVWGAESPGVAFDCSGLTKYCYSCIGISLDHYTGSQYANAREIRSVSAARAGDILWKDGHVGICIEDGGGAYIHAPQDNDVVKISTKAQFSCSLRYV